jgi:AraC-like DNA-binding protein
MRIVHQILPSEQLQAGGPTIYCYEVDLPKLDPYWHFHEPMELTLIRRGRGMRMVGNHVGEFAESDLVMLGPNLVHGWTAKEQEDGTCLISGVHFPRDLVERYSEWSVLDKLFEQARFGVYFPNPPRELQDQIARLYGSSIQERLLLFFQILMQLKDLPFEILASNPNPDRISNQQEKVLRVMAYILDNCDQDITLDEMADFAGLNNNYFSRWFRSRVGQRYVDFLSSARVAKACTLFLEDLSIAQIAHRSGFESVRSFNRNFKRIKGLTPGEFRRKLER